MFIKDGNFTPLFRALIWGTALTAAALFYCLTTGKLMFWGIIISVVIAAIGAYAETANTLGIKPFDSSYTKAKSTYNKTEEKDKENKPQK